jgi:uncharacterized protein YbbK (DUF523 family)
MIRILVSACLLGDPVRFDGRAKTVEDPRLARWRAEGRLVPFCPEVEGGLPVPRIPAERQAEGRVRDAAGVDRTEAFRLGARKALDAAREAGCRLALLKERSPSCGVHEIYDGSFTAKRIPGQGITAEILREAGLEVFSENELDALESKLEGLQQR